MKDSQLSKRRLLLLSDICLIIVAALWGSSYGVAKLSLQFYPVLGFLTIRFGLTTLILLPVLLKSYSSNKAQLQRTFTVGVPLGFILLAIFLFETYGLFHTTAANAAFLISLCLIMTPFMEWLLLKNRPHNLVFSCAIVSLIGTYLLTIDTADTVGLSFKLSINLGDSLILMAALCRALMVTMTKKLLDDKRSPPKLLAIFVSSKLNQVGDPINVNDKQIATKQTAFKPLDSKQTDAKPSNVKQDNAKQDDTKQISSLALTAVQTLVVFVGCLVIFLLSSILMGERLSLPTESKFWFPTLYLVVFCTIFAFFVQNWAVKVGSPSRASLLMGSEPVFGALFAVILFNEHVGMLGWIGGSLITMSSVALVLRQ